LNNHSTAKAAPLPTWLLFIHKYDFEKTGEKEIRNKE
jgi:hypothetical protein